MAPCTIEPLTHLIQHFYESFARKDHAAMAACYSDSAVFSDPVFPQLDATHVRGMWRMFCRPDGDLRIELASSELNGNVGKARWIAHYPFPATGRRVVNVIDASFDL